MAVLSAKTRKGMPASQFAGGKSKSKPTGSFPLNDKAHVAAAESYKRFASPAEKSKINAAAARDFPKGKQGAGMVKKPGK